MMSQTQTVMPRAALSRDELLAEVIRLAAAQVGADPSTVTADTHFQNDLGYDSLDVVEFVMTLEERFDVAIDDADAESIRTIAAAVENVQQLLAARA
jgi:acyl carrier protein